MIRFNGIRANRGSDVEFSFIWPDIDNEPLDLTGWTLGVFENSPQLDELITVSSDDPETGVVKVLVEWDEALLEKAQYQLRVQAVESGVTITTNLIQIRYS